MTGRGRTVRASALKRAAFAERLCPAMFLGVSNQEAVKLTVEIGGGLRSPEQALKFGVGGAIRDQAEATGDPARVGVNDEDRNVEGVKQD